jgi:membrane protease YdiL (CAAX protease family)
MSLDERNPTSDAEPSPAPRAPWEVGPVAVPPPSTAPDAVFCRRCGETAVPAKNCCPWCGAWVVGDPPEVAPTYEGPDDDEDDWHAELRDDDFKPPAPKKSQAMPLVVVAVSYFLLLASLIFFSFVAVIYHLQSEEEMYAGLGAVEALDAVLTVAALGLVWKTARQPKAVGTGALAWLVAWPMLAALLAVNILFITYLRELFKPFGPVEAEKMKVTLVTVLLICVQPAIVEELFFRQMVLGVFRKSMATDRLVYRIFRFVPFIRLTAHRELGFHSAVWLTAALFAFAHLGNIVGMPYLFLAGVVFGYARVFGGLPLAMLMHFVHNFVVIAYAAWH